VTLELPVFVMVTLCEAEEVPVVTLSKVNVAACPAVTVWFPGCVVIAGATVVPFAMKFTPVTFVVPRLTFRFAGVNV
jgi:hypothetical protein